MGRPSLGCRLVACVVVVLLAGAAHAQPFPMPPRPRVIVPPPVMPPPRPFYRPRLYAPAPPAYAPTYYQPVNLAYARKARILRGIGIPLLSVGVPMAVAGGIVWIVGAACRDCSDNVSFTGIGLLAAGVGLLVPGAILTGIGNYYDWMARVMARASFGVAFARDRGAATLRLRF